MAVEALALQGQTQIAQALHNYLEQQKSQQEQAITAAAQLLDPMAKLRLMKALQDQQQATTARLDAIDPALLSALQGLAMHTPTQLPPVPVTAAAALSRHSMDGGVSYGGMHQPPPLRPAVHASFSRRSVDIGSVARGEAGLMPMGLPPQAPQAFAGAARPVNLNDFAVPPAVAASSFAMSSGVAVSAPSPQAPLLLGSLPTASYMEFAAGRGRNTGGDGRGSTTSHLYSAGDVAGSVGAAAGGQLPAEEPSLVPSASDSDRSGRLHSIDEANPYEETGDTSSASSSVVNSSNASSSGDHLLVKGHGTTVQRVMSFDK